MNTYTVNNVDYSWLTGPMLLLWLAVAVVMIAAMWKIFAKADEAGWKSLIPFYNSYTMFRIAGRNGWWFLLMGIPLVNVVLAVMLALDLAKHFGKSTLFGIFGLLLFPYVGALMLAFGDAKYVGPKHS